MSAPAGDGLQRALIAWEVKDSREVGRRPRLIRQRSTMAITRASCPTKRSSGVRRDRLRRLESEPHLHGLR